MHNKDKNTKPKSKYPWDQWMSCPNEKPNTVGIAKGVHYYGRTDTMIQLIRNHASHRKLRVEFDLSPDDSIIVFTVFPKNHFPTLL